MGGLMDGLGADQRYQRGANYFPPLTPEQQAMIDRDKINESLGPFDFAPGLITGVGAGIGAAALPFVAKTWPWYARYYGPKQAGAYAAQEGGAVLGIPTALGYALDMKQRALDRHDQEQKMMFGSPADAEGQPGGFYGRGR